MVFAAAGAYTFRYPNMYAAIGWITICAQIVFAATGAYTFRYLNMYDAIGGITICAQIVIPTLEIAYPASKTSFRMEKKGRLCC